MSEIDKAANLREALRSNDIKPTKLYISDDRVDDLARELFALSGVLGPAVDRQGIAEGVRNGKAILYGMQVVVT